jgi:hypothetical protein
LSDFRPLNRRSVSFWRVSGDAWSAGLDGAATIKEWSQQVVAEMTEDEGEVATALATGATPG